MIDTLPGLVPPAPAQPAQQLSCRLCTAPLRHTFVDLGSSPLCERFLRHDQLDLPEPFYPLHARVCDRCWLVQLQAFVPPEEIFGEYAYFSSYSDSWVAHARAYAVQMIEELPLGPASRVVEVASNDGYLLQHFVERGIPALGVEPAANVAAEAVRRRVPTLVRFFGKETARSIVAENGAADLLIGNNVLAQVPDLHDFVTGLKLALAPRGVITLEFPHLMRLVAQNQFDTIYHEHFSYFSLLAVERLLGAHGLALFDVEELGTHGGSLRIYARHAEDSGRRSSTRLSELRERERAEGLDRMEYYQTFARRVHETKRALLDFLIRAKREHKSVAGYGAPGKGNTLLNYCGIRSDLLEYTVDRNPYKHGRYCPGTRIPIHPPERIAETRPDFVLVLPWNLRQEIMTQLAYIRSWGGRFVFPIPTVEVAR